MWVGDVWVKSEVIAPKMGHPDFMVVEGQQPPWYTWKGGEETSQMTKVIGGSRICFLKIKIERHDKILSQDNA